MSRTVRAIETIVVWTLIIGLITTGLLLAIAPVPTPVTAQSGRLIPLADTSVTSTAAVEVDAAYANRRALVCTNTDSAIHVRVGGTTAPTTTTGVQLRAGLSITITSTDKVQMRAESGTVTVACSREVQ